MLQKVQKKPNNIEGSCDETPLISCLTEMYFCPNESESLPLQHGTFEGDRMKRTSCPHFSLPPTYYLKPVTALESVEEILSGLEKIQATPLNLEQ